MSAVATSPVHRGDLGTAGIYHVPTETGEEVVFLNTDHALAFCSCKPGRAVRCEHVVEALFAALVGLMDEVQS